MEKINNGVVKRFVDRTHVNMVIVLFLVGWICPLFANAQSQTASWNVMYYFVLMFCGLPVVTPDSYLLPPFLRKICKLKPWKCINTCVEGGS